jgi:hypothetical protein
VLPGGAQRHPGPGLTLLAMASAASAAVPEDPLRRPQEVASSGRLDGELVF